MKKTVTKFGFIGGSIVSAFMLCTMPFMDVNSDMQMSQLIGYATMIVAFTTIFIGVKSYRDNELGGFISFRKAFLVGLYIALIASTMYVVCWMILSEFFMGDFMEVYMNASIEQMNAEGLAQIDIDSKIAEMKEMAEMYKNPIFKFLFTYIEILPVGLLMSLISAAVFKKKALA